MKPDPENNEEDERVSLRVKISELERELREEKHKFEIFQADTHLCKFFAVKETEKYTRDLSSLNEHVRRLEEDLKTLRKREVADRARMKKLLAEFEKKDQEFSEKSVQFKVENRDLERAKRTAQDGAREWMNKFASLKSRESILVAEISRLKKKDCSFMRTIIINIDNEDDGEVPMRTEGCAKRKCPEELALSTPEPKRKIGLVVAVDDGDGNCSDEEDMITLAQLQKKMLTAIGDGATKNSACVAISRRYAVCSEVSMSGHVGAKKPSTIVADVQSPISAPNAALDQVRDSGFPSFCKRYPQNLRSTTYAGRDSSSEQRQCRVLIRAEELWSKLKSGHPSFIKTMVQSHVSGCFWLGIPTKFCMENLPICKMGMILEDEEGQEYEVIYVGDKFGFSGGWKHFASAHCLEIGDALIFELSGPASFKVYIIKANMERDEDANSNFKICVCGTNMVCLVLLFDHLL